MIDGLIFINISLVKVQICMHYLPRRYSKNSETFGEKLHSEYVEQRLVRATTTISHPLSKQQLPLFIKRGTKVRSRSQLEVADLKVDRDLMSRVYVSVFEPGMEKGETHVSPSWKM